GGAQRAHPLDPVPAGGGGGFPAVTAATRDEVRAFLPPRRVLALADLTPAARNALWRAALIAREYGAALHVLHVARDARGVAEAQAALEQSCAAVQERLGVQGEIEVLRGDLQREATRAARD